MGTGTFGSGGGGVGSSGRDYASMGGTYSANGRLRNTRRPQADVKADAYKVLDTLPAEYLTRYFESDALQSTLRALLDIQAEIRFNQRWDTIAENYQVPDGPGVLRRLRDTLVRRVRETETDERIAYAGTAAIQDYFLKAVGDEPQVYMRADAAAVIAARRDDVLASTAGHFLGLLLANVLDKEDERMNRPTRSIIRKIGVELADALIAQFEASRRHAGNIRYGELLGDLADNPDWLKKAVHV